MAKEKYYYNLSTLKYEKVKVSWKKRLLSGLALLCTSLLFAFILVYLINRFIPSPNEVRLRNEIDQMKVEYTISNKKLEEITKVLYSLRERDKNIYRVLFESEPIPDEIWQAGVGGANRYESLDDLSNGALIKSLKINLDRVQNQLVIQSKSYDDIVKLVKNNEDKLASIPAIQPVSNRDLKRIASGFGVRIDPVYGTPRMHAGIDFTAPIGTEIYATGKGKIVEVSYNTGGYGNHIIIDHGYGYKSHYAHLSRFNVTEGQTVQRGQVIGYVGNTGKSVGPHLHYEIIYNDSKINPVHFFYNDLTQEQYQAILNVAESNGKTLD